MSRKYYCVTAGSRVTFDNLCNDDECRCKFIKQRKEAATAGRLLPIYIVSFGISRHFGGHEEGGWWYDWTSINEVRIAHTVVAALKHARELKEEYPSTRFGRGSMASGNGADNYIKLCYNESDPCWPEETTQKPHYE